MKDRRKIMLTKTQIKEIKDHLEKAQNPIFFFDNDADGFCSFLILQRFIRRGKGVPVRSFPGLNKEYFRKVSEFGSDYVFILDKPVVEKDFFEEAEKINVPIVWIDHHEIDKSTIPKFIHYYNPFHNKGKSNEPVTYLCYSVSKKKEDMWLEIAGCVSDRFVPKEYDEFTEKYPDLSVKSKNAFDIFYKSQIGKIARIFGSGLKDRTTNVINMIRFLMKVKTPYEVLEENSKNHTMHRRFNQISSIYQKLLNKAVPVGRNQGKILFFQYGGDMSISSELSNELNYMFPDKIIVVAYISGIKANVSVRGKNVREIVLSAISDLENATGGGHENAVGAQVRIEDLEKFRKNMEKIITKS